MGNSGMEIPEFTQTCPFLGSIYAEIQLLLEWKKGFGLYFVLSDDPFASDALRQRVEELTLGCNHPLQCIRTEQPETLVETVLSAILPSTPSDQWQAQNHAPVWLDLTSDSDEQAWNTARIQTLAALNRGRSRLEQQYQRPLFLQLPMHMAADIVTWAPDLWSIREYVALVPAAHAISLDELKPNVEHTST